MTEPDPTYFDPDTPERNTRRGTRNLWLLFALISVVVGVAIGAGENFDWAYFLIGTAAIWLTLTLLGAFLLLLSRKQAPHAPVTCRNCRAIGWIEDIARTQGACPRCGQNRFDFHEFRFGRYGAKHETRIDDIEGTELIARNRGWFRR